MLEGLVAWVLNTYLGKYVNNLNTDQLSVALLKGAVELENLPLKKDALKELELPFEVKAGLIGKVTLQIPFYRPHVDPWVISISSLHLIGAPEKIQDFNDEKEKLLERERKKALLQALEEKWKSERQQKGESYWYSVTASVVTRIVENIELKIQDVHLRFEDGVTSPSHPFAFGICIKNVSVQNAVNEPVQKLMRKKQLDVAEFSIYWDVDCTLLGDLPQVELQEAMDKSMESRNHHYILEPVCASALLKRNCSKEPLRSRHTPRIECDIQLETIPLKLSQLQYRQIMEFLKELERKERQVKFRKWKPKVAISENCREWWYFALNANLSEIREQRKRCTWDFLLHRARDAVSYTDKYFSKLKGGLLSADDKEEICRIEEEQSFEELKILRELVHERFHKQEELAESLREPQFDSPGDSPGDPEAGGGSGMLQYLQSWFPGWGGWYGQQTPEGKPVEGLSAEQHEQWTPEEILGTEEFFDPAADASCLNTYTKRDHVFAKLNLQLQRGTVTLLHQEQGTPQTEESAFMQLEFSDVKLLAESLPRRNSSLLLVRLGGLFLRDLATEGTMFPLLVFPNPQKEVGRVSQSFGLQTTSADRSDHYPAADPDDPVFEMLYERNPVHSHFERRLHVSTRPLNIIYNPQAIKKVADFFYKGKVHTSGFGYQSELELRVAEAARRQYNKLKMQTKAEIRQTLDRLLVGDFIEESKRWTVRLDISAPQVIFPDDFKFKNPVLVVVDLGRMLLTNTQDDSKRKSGDGSASEENQFSDDEYKTPLATPPNTPPPETSSSNNEEKIPPFSGVEFSEEQLQAHLMSTKMYERYSLSFMDLQVMVGRVKDNWKHVQDIDVGPTHVVEKFNVHLQLERRLIYTSDPKYPGAVLSGNLPDLKIHINEDKISALKNCFALLTTPEMKTSETLIKERIFPQEGQRGSLQDSVMNLTQSFVMLEQRTREVLVESQLLLAEFKVNCMQLGVESNGRYISVLKVFGTNAHFVKRPYDAEVSLTVHGLLLVDTMQTYGADFDLLMASHKNLSFDIPTGSLRDSRAQSPVSESNVVPFTNAATLNDPSATGVSLDRILTKEQESLIKLEYQFVSSECPSMNLDSTLQVISLQVNNLDIILNPETIVELIGFLQKSFPKEKDDLSPQPLVTNFERSFREQGTYQSTYEQNTEVAVEIHRLNLLLLRTVGMANGEKYGRKIATASIGGTKVNVSMGSTFDMNGSLGCLQLMDLTQDNIKNQYVVSIGNSIGYENIISDIGYFESVFVRMEDAALSEALSFTFVEKSKQECFLNLKMASLHYNHSAKFLKELTLSMDELEENFRSMLKSAATKVTTVLATKTAEYSEMVSLFETPRKMRESFILEESEIYGFGLAASHSDTVKLILNINIESPVVSIPRKPGSPELLVGHLGQIFIQNFVGGDDESRSDRLQVEIKDIKLYSLNCTQLAGREGPGSEVGPAFCPPSGSASANSQEEAHFTRHDFFESLHRGQAFHILNDTTIQFKLEKIPIERESELTFSLSLDDLGTCSIMKIEGKFVNPVQVHSLSLVLNKTTSELAKANVSKLVAHLEMIEGDLALQGSIGSLSLSDLTAHGEFYRERFTTSGEEALIFQTFKYGRPDPLLRREHDVRVSLQMASVQYVHTQRFQAEVVAFIQHFTQLQDVLGRQRAAIEGQTVRDQAQRGSRVLLDIEAGAPVLLIPESSRSNNLIVANLGKLKVKNKFLFAGFPGTFSLQDKESVPSASPTGTPKHSLRKMTSTEEPKGTHFQGLFVMPPAGMSLGSLKSEFVPSASTKQQGQQATPSVRQVSSSPEDHVCLLDCIVVDLQDMDIFAAERHPREYSKASEDSSGDLIFPSYFVRQTGGSLLTEPCRLKLQVERNLDKEISHTVPDISIHGNLSSVHCSLDLYKYKLIRGLLENNLGEPIEEFMRPYDLQDPRIHTVLSGEVYTCMCFLIDMVNVSLELKDPKVKEGAGSLARFDFKKCRLLYESFSNQTKSVNLVSHSMMAFDTRCAGQKTSPGTTNVFSCIFQPSKNSSTTQGSIQIELHFRSTKDSSCFTVVLNNLRVFLIFDWLLLVHDFLHTPSDIKKQTNVTPRHRNSSSESAIVPKAVKSGVVTKRSSLPVSTERHLEVKVNVTGTEFVVVEDVSCFDTNAIILKGTTVLTYKPRFVDRPFSGSLFGIEVFSCRLGNEHDTALSIVDPVQIQVELVGNSSYQNSSGLMDAFNSEDFPPILEIQLQALDIRLSYNDVQLFLAIAKSIPEQANAAVPDAAALEASSVSTYPPGAPRVGEEVKEGTRHTLDPILELQLARLQELGFSMDDCRKALLVCQGQLKKAASWLFKNAEPLKALSLASNSRESQGTVPAQLISGVEIKAESVCICFIDDCMDCDVPLAELTFSRLNFLQHVRTSPEGYAHFTLSGDYYNRALSGWEPFIEPWPCSVSWQQQAASRLHPPRLKLEAKAKPRLDINITSVLIDQYVSTKESWMADYCKQDKEIDSTTSEDWMGSSVDPPCFGQSLPLVYLRTRSTASLTNLEHQIYARAEVKTPKRRQPFVPFALRNHTGCTLWFATLTTTPTRAALSHSGSPGVVPEGNGTFFDDAHNVSEWREVLTGEEIPFEFEARGKLRHRHTHDLRIHQLQVRVNGWEQVSPVSVDKVGTFFRYAAPDKNSSSSTIGSPSSRTNIIHPQVYFSSLPPVRVVFAVTMEGSARKVITVRSALIVKNRLETPMELRLDSPSAPDKPVVLPAILPGDSFAVPLHLTSWRLQARPKGLGVFFCKAPIHWTNVVKTTEVSSSKRECHSMDTEKSRFFRFCVAIKKENYPDYMPSNIFSDSAKQIFRQPGHTIYLLPTVVICNLLPCELDFYVKGVPINGTLKPGKEVALHTADTSQNIELGVSLENFPLCKELLIPPGTQNYMVRMRLYDVSRRQLNLTIRIVCRAEGSLKIFISAPYWLINKTGLPLIFRQDNAKTDAAGQFEEHELARSLSPLLFCYADKEQPNLCTMRVGRGIHPEGMPGWCQGFSLDGGSGVRALKVIQQGNRPGLIYNIGIDVKKGRGRYIDTSMVIFAPRYLLDNKSSHKLAFAQREFARGQGTANPEGYISTLPGSSVVFHWPRNDYDQLLCVRLMDVPNCIWSGGFEVNKNNSFHINMRDTLGKCFFLRVEITLRGATYRISFSDTDQLPPPFRIDNFSKVPVVFTQHGVAEPRLRTEVKPMTSLDYAWDEPTLPPFITLTVKGAGSSEINCNMNDFQDNRQLYYENFIYIAATYTFSGLQEGTGRPVASNKAITCAELVLDVSPKTQRVILKKKEPGKRSQLWRMTGTGMLAHEGSSVPHNPNKPSAARSTEGSAILDIAGLAAVTDNRYEPLMLRKPDRRRSTTQTWSFREGRLTCGLHGLVVQAKGGLSGLFDGAEVVLGPDTSMELLGPVPPEQQFIDQKMRPGSGILSIRVIPDGPTRALQITDFSQRKSDRSSYEVDELPVTEQELQKLKNPDTEQELEVLVKLEGGIGLSLINKVPEELVFASLTGINVHYTQLATSHMLELSIQDVQVDNQLIGTTQPFMLYVTPLSNENEVIETGPAVQVNAVKFPSKSALTNIYKHLMITAQRFTVQIEEKLLLKLLSFFGYDQAESEVEKYDENLHEKTAEQGGTPIRYYFENLKISIPQIKLSVFTSNKLPLDLKALKSTLGFPLIRFEDAVINLDPFTRVHPYETKEFIINDILKHFQEELLSQAARILGSVDFLGNPMGLLNDVSEGVTGLIKYGNVGGLIRNVTHGVSNSAAKFAGTLSDGLGKTMDNRHQSEREYIRYHAATSGEHLVAGIHGLAHGIIGGLTSVITSTVEGVKTEGGVSGFISGLGKGLVGTVTKPVAGALDFASETAQAVRDTATLSGSRTQAQRVRKPRCCTGPQGLLPRYSESQAEGQEQLFKLTDNIQDEFFIAVENIDSYCVLISSKAVYFLKSGDYVDREAIFLEVKYDDLYHCLVSKDHGKVYVQVTKKAVNTSSGVSIPGPSHQKPMVHVKSEVLAVKLSQEINYAKSLYYEQQLMLRLNENQEQLELDS
ncbi:intermembrane lipid transfer protein VPS13D isoform X7 [Diceros bicornis minor]|uniref:intermembrane lipid transfer protein VPS13D isoform X7 n=1 Tax=Diceros bicornis minor TaxID=77932 RepID=UPI0026F207C8|nr:intermembrane lipid transfer protein VPS13D isoform X7 [Diceros bicornis minor]